MSAFNDVLNKVIDLAEELNPYAEIIIGNTPPANGIAMFISSGNPNITDLEKGMVYSMHVMLNAKHTNQEIAFDTISDIHQNLTKTKSYPNEEEYQILNISTFTLPTLIDREENGSYIFGSTLNVEFYWRKNNGIIRNDSERISEL
jgi:hypothetical protein